MQPRPRRKGYKNLNDALFDHYYREWTDRKLTWYCERLYMDGPGDLPSFIYQAYMRIYLPRRRKRQLPSPAGFREYLGWLACLVNERLVTQIAGKFLAKASGAQSGLLLSDLIHEGYLGVLHSLTLFDRDLDIAFSTYASWWIRQSIVRAIERAHLRRGVNLPIDKQNQLRQFDLVKIGLEHEVGREVTDEEVMRCIMERRLALSGHEKKESQLRELNELRRPASSLDAELSTDTDTKFHELLNDQQTPSPEDYAFFEATVLEARQLQWQMGSALLAKGVRNCVIFCERMGFNGKPKSLELLGQQFEVTRERIRQIEGKGLALVGRKFGLSRDEIEALPRQLEAAVEYISAYNDHHSTHIRRAG